MACAFRSCIHTHSNFCDGLNPPEEMVQRALELNFVSLGFSGHGPVFWDTYAMTEENLPQYRAEVRRLQAAYADRLEIFLGLEHDSLAPQPEEDYDYMLESVHAIEHGGMLCYIDWDLEKTQTAIREAFGGDPYAYTRAYYEACAQAYTHTKARFVGHLDLVTKFQEKQVLFDESDPRYWKPALEAMDTALERGMILELNTGAISRGYRTAPYPSTFLLRHLLERKAPIIVTSDCHNKDFLDCWYEEAAELLKSIGFRSTLRMRKTGLEELPL